MSKPEIPFDMEAALKALREGQSLTGKDGILTPLIKQLTEAAIQAELECVYKAATLNAAELALDDLETKWGEKYPMVITSWRNKWPTLSNYFKYPDYVRTAIYTTNAVEAVHRQFRKLTKTKGGFANENSLLKLLYAGILKASERWTHPIQNWNLTLAQLTIHFPGRLEKHLSL